MLFTTILLFFLFLCCSAFFSASETAFIASDPFSLDYLEKKGVKRAKLLKNMLSQIEKLLVTILVGNTLANAAAASVSTLIFVTLLPNKNQALLAATITTSLLILFFGEINPKIFAAYNPMKVAFLVLYPVRLLVFLFYPFVRAFTTLSGLLFPSFQEKKTAWTRALSEEEVKVILKTRTKDISTPRKKMMAEILDIGSRPIKEIIVPRPEVKAIEIHSSADQILQTILETEYSRFPVYNLHLDNIEGIIHAKDIIPYLVENKKLELKNILRKPFFIPESASLEQAFLQMQENAIHLAFVVDEFGNMEGIVTLEDIMEEIVGDIKDEYDAEVEGWFHELEKNVFLIHGSAAVKEVNERVPLHIPEKYEYTTLAGFLLHELGRIPQEGESLDYGRYTFRVEKINKRHISLVRVTLRK